MGRRHLSIHMNDIFRSRHTLQIASPRALNPCHKAYPAFVSFVLAKRMFYRLHDHSHSIHSSEIWRSDPENNVVSRAQRLLWAWIQAQR